MSSGLRGHFTRILGVSLALVVAGVVACSDEASGPRNDLNQNDPPADTQTGTLAIRVTTVGTQVDSDGYLVVLSDGQSVAVSVNDLLELANLPLGQWTIEILGLANNCSATGSVTRSVEVTGGVTITVDFTITCVDNTGEVVVTTTTTGEDLDPNGYWVRVVGGVPVPIGIDDQVTLEAVAAGDREVKLEAMAPNCKVEGDNPKPVSVPEDGSVQVDFEIACTADVTPPATGSLKVVTSTTGDGVDSDGYAVVVDGGAPVGVDVDGMLTIDDVPAGERSVELTEVADNCGVNGENPRLVDVPENVTAETTFNVVCSDPSAKVGFRFVLKDIFTGNKITSAATLTIDGIGYAAVDGVFEGEVDPGDHTFALIDNDASYDADRIELPGGEVRVLFQRFPTDVIRMTGADFDGTIYRPSKSESTFDLQHYLATWESPQNGRQMPRSDRLVVYLVTTGYDFGCADATQDRIDEWRAFQQRFQAEMGGMYNVVLQEGGNPPAQAENNVIVCVGFGHYGNWISSGVLGEMAGGGGKSFPNGNSERMINNSGYAYPLFAAGEEDSSCRVPSLFNPQEACGNATDDLTEYDRSEGIVMGYYYGRPAAIRRVETGGTTPFFSLRQP